MSELPAWWWLAPVGASAALAASVLLNRWMMAAPDGDADMRAVAGRVREGSFAYLRRQYQVVSIALAGRIRLPGDSSLAAAVTKERFASPYPRSASITCGSPINTTAASTASPM